MKRLRNVALATVIGCETATRRLAVIIITCLATMQFLLALPAHGVDVLGHSLEALVEQGQEFKLVINPRTQAVAFFPRHMSHNQGAALVGIASTEGEFIGNRVIRGTVTPNASGSWRIEVVPGAVAEKFPRWGSEEFVRNFFTDLAKNAAARPLINATTLAELELTIDGRPPLTRATAKEFFKGMFAAVTTMLAFYQFYTCNLEATEQEIEAAARAKREPDFALAQLRTAWLMTGIPQAYTAGLDHSRKSLREELDEIERLTRAGQTRDMAKIWALVHKVAKDLHAIADHFTHIDATRALPGELVGLFQAAIDRRRARRVTSRGAFATVRARW